MERKPCLSGDASTALGEALLALLLLGLPGALVTPAQGASSRELDERSIAVLFVDDRAVGPDEFAWFLEQERAGVFAEATRRCGAEDGPGFWDRPCGGKTPREMLLESAVRRSTREVVERAFLQEIGLVRDAGFESFEEALDAENRSRERASRDGRAVYGPVRFTPLPYYGHWKASLRLEAMRGLARAGYEELLDARVAEARVRQNREPLDVPLPFATTAAAALASGSAYYVDSVAGDDANPGTSPDAAWKTLAKVNGTTFAPGDSILLKAGGAWTGTLSPKGSGSPGNPIVVDLYGAGPKPIINGNGATDAVYLNNQAYWEINNLEVTNDASSDAERRGVHFAAANYGTVNHLYVRNCFVHDVRGLLSSTDGDLTAKRTGGIVVETTSDSAVPTRFNDVRIENNTIRSVRNEGIVAAGNRSGQNDFPGTSAWNARKATNLVIRNNTISDVTKNAMILRLADPSCLVEHNLCYNTANATTGNTMFTAACDGVVFQYNEGYDNRAGDHDGSLYDADLRSVNVKFQYSYSHDNSHGLFWQYNHSSDTGIVVRYNISRSDRGDIFAFSGNGSGSPTVYAYNNTIFIPADLSPRIVDDRTSAHTYFFYNNVIYNLSATASYHFTSGNTRTFDHNVFYGQHPSDEPADPHGLRSDPELAAPGTGGVGIDTLDGYKLRASSPCIDSGTTVPNDGGLDFWGGAVPHNVATDRGAHEWRLAAAPPPSIPDGGPDPGAPLRAERSGDSVVVTWDATRCPAIAVNIYRGTIGDYSTFVAGDCGLPPTGSATLALPDNVWFLAAATDGAAIDGSWGRTPMGTERNYLGASVACPGIASHDPSGTCP